MAECGAVDFNCKGTALVDNVTDGLATDIKEGTSDFIVSVFAGWMNVPVPLIGEDFGPVGFLRSHLILMAGMVLGISTILFAIRLMWKPSREVIGTGANFYLRVMVITSGAVTLSRMLIFICDGYADWIIESATRGTGLADTVLTTLQLTGPLGWFLAALFGIIGFIAALCQGVLLAARNVMLPFLVGASPLVVSASQGELGQTWWTKYLSWFTAFLLYKPTAATIYAVGFYMLEEGSIIEAESIAEGALKGMNFIYGIMTLGLAVLAFGALMSVVTPVTGKLTGGMAGAAIIGASAASLGATGAVNMMGGAGGSGNPSVGAPVSVSPTNGPAGNDGAGAKGGDGSSGPPGGMGGPGSPGSGPTGPSGPGGSGLATAAGGHPVVAGVKFAADTGAKAHQSFNQSLNDKEDQ